VRKTAGLVGFGFARTLFPATRLKNRDAEISSRDRRPKRGQIPGPGSEKPQAARVAGLFRPPQLQQRLCARWKSGDSARVAVTSATLLSLSSEQSSRMQESQ